MLVLRREAVKRVSERQKQNEQTDREAAVVERESFSKLGVRHRGLEGEIQRHSKAASDASGKLKMINDLERDPAKAEADDPAQRRIEKADVEFQCCPEHPDGDGRWQADVKSRSVEQQ